MKKIILIMYLSIVVVAAHATTHYASRTGTAAFIVSSETNPMALSFALNSALPGDSVLLTGDFTFTANEIFIGEKEDIYYGTYGGGATLIGSDYTGGNGISIIVIKDSRDITIEGFDFRDNYGQNARAVFIYGSGENISVVNNTIERIGWTTTDNFLLDPVGAATGGQNGSSNSIIALGNHYPGVVTNISVSDPDDDGKLMNVTVSGNTLDSLVLGTSEGITIAGNVEGFEVSNNTITDVTNIAIDAAGHFSFVQPFEIDPNTGVQYLPFDETIYADLNQSREGVISDNTVTNAVSQVAVSAGIYCDGCKDVVIRNNFVSESGTGFSIGCEVGGGNAAENVSLVNNISRDNQQSGMFIGSITSEGEEELSTVKNCVIRNNVLYDNNALGLTFFNTFAIALSKGDSNEISNNIIHLREGIEGSTTDAVGLTVFDGIAPNITNYTIANNLFYRTSGATVSAAEQLNANGSGLTISGSIVADPSFIDLNNNLFEIPNTSPAVNAGSAITLVANETDFDGDARVQGDIVDIGAQETDQASVIAVVTLYKDCGFGGYAIGLEEGSYTRPELEALGMINDDISSVQVSSGYQVTMFEHGYFNGHSLIKTEDDNCLINDSFNDVIGSVIVEKIPAATVYDFCNYGGYAIDLEVGSYTMNDLITLGIGNDDLESITITSGYKVTFYIDDNFQGSSLVRTSDDSCLPSAFDDNVSSLIVEEYDAVVTVYDFGGFAIGGWGAIDLEVGNYTIADLNALGIDNDDIEGFTIESGYQITLYKHNYFMGDMLVSTSDVACLASNLNDEVSSIKIEVISSARIASDVSSNLDNIKISAYPNPASNTINITGLSENQSIQIYSVSGKLMMETSDLQINISSFEKGLYLIKTQDQQTIRFIKK